MGADNYSKDDPKEALKDAIYGALKAKEEFLGLQQTQILAIRDELSKLPLTLVKNEEKPVAQPAVADPSEGA